MYKSIDKYEKKINKLKSYISELQKVLVSQTKLIKNTEKNNEAYDELLATSNKQLETITTLNEEMSKLKSVYKKKFEQMENEKRQLREETMFRPYRVPSFSQTIDAEDINLESLNINEVQANTIQHSWHYTVQLNPITFYDNSNIQPNNDHQVWKETNYLSLYKHVLSVLNKLTWTTFDKLFYEFQKLSIENIECLENIANIVALKAFDEPNFGSLYASLCRATDITLSFQDRNGLSYQTTFNKCIIKVCQNYFQKHCLDTRETIFISEEHEQIHRRLKIQTIGCIRCIGEIFKQSLLSPYVIHCCVKTLVSNSNERSLEYLCNLLKVAGKELNEKISVEDVFEHLLFLVSDEMSSKISPRMRFMV